MIYFNYNMVPSIDTISRRFVPVYEESTSRFALFVNDKEAGCIRPIDFDNEEEASEANAWMLRPEYKLGQKINLDCTHDELVIQFEEMLVGALWGKICRSYETNQDHLNSRANAILTWLRSTDFYAAPASTAYHDSEYGGLLKHSIKVYNNAIDLYHLDKFTDVELDSIVLCSLTHDWCKIGYYVSYNKNVKDDRTGTWHQETAYMVDQRGVPLGHGVSSMFLASRFVSLDADEALALRWHMGRWNCCEIELSELQKANESCPLVYLIQFADQLACVKY